MTNTWEIRTVANPIKARLENLSFERNEFLIICELNYPNVIRMIAIVINPSSSPITDSIKSDSCTGRNFNCVCVPSPHPFPNIPPEPIAVLL